MRRTIISLENGKIKNDKIPHLRMLTLLVGLYFQAQILLTLRGLD